MEDFQQRSKSQAKVDSIADMKVTECQWLILKNAIKDTLILYSTLPVISRCC